MSANAKTWISSYFSGMFFVWGVFLPFWSIWLESQGMGLSEIGVLMGFGLAARFAGNLLIMQQVKRASHLINAIRWVSFASLLVLASLLWLNNYFWLCALTLMANFLIATLIPLGDAVATNWLSQGKLDYGRVRVCGSIAFVASSSLLGWLLTHYSSDSILYLAIASMLVSWLLSCIKTRDALFEEDKSQRSSKSIMQVFKQGHALRFIAITALIQGAHAGYYTYGSLYMKSIGLAESTIGYLWSLGVICEMSVLLFGGRWFKSWSPQQMFMLAAVGGVIRWGLLAETELLGLLAVSQGMHALTFALAQLAAIKYIAQEAPDNEAIGLQTLYSAFSLNLFTALLTFLCSALYVSWKGDIFLIMAGLNIVAFCLLLVGNKKKPRAAGA